MPHLEKYSQQDITDRSQASSSRSGSPEKLQQLRRAHGFQSEQKSNGKGIMSAEVQDQYNRAAIDKVIKQRGGITSPQSEIRLGYQEGLRGGAYAITPTNLDVVLRNEMPSHYDVINTDLQRSVTLLIRNFNKLGGSNCIKPILENWKEEGSAQKKKFAEIMLD